MDYAFPPHSDMSDPWRDKAACRNLPGTGNFAPDAWVNEYSLSVKAENEVCNTCPVRELCLADALTDPDAEGRRNTYYFEQGKLTRADAHRLWNERRITARVRNTGVSGTEDIQEV